MPLSQGNTVSPAQRALTGRMDPYAALRSAFTSSQQANNTAAAGGMSYKPNNSQGYGGMNIAPPAPTSAPAPVARTQPAAYTPPAADPLVQKPQPTALKNQPVASTVPTVPVTPAAPPPAAPAPDPYSYGGIVRGLVNNAAQPNQGLDEYNQKVKDIVQQRANLQTDLQTKLGQIAADPGLLDFRVGRQNQLEMQAAAKDTALSQQLQALSAQEGVLNQNQQIQQTGLGTAGNLAAPQQVSYSNQYLNPTTGQPVNPGGNDAMNNAVALQVQRIKSNNSSLSDAQSALSAYGQAGTNALQQALGSGFNVNTNAGSAAAQGAVASTQGQQVEAYKSALQQGKNLQAQLTDLISTFGLNPNDVNKVNSGLQAIAANVSDPHYKQLANYVNDIANTYAQVLTPPGGSATDTSRGIATSMLDATAKGTSIISTMQSLDNAAQAKIAGVPTQGHSNSPASGAVIHTSYGAINPSL